MLKTNSKIVKQRLAQFILENTNLEDGEEPKTVEEACEYLAKDFERREGYRWKYPRHECIQDAFFDFGQGLPNNLFDFFTRYPKDAWDILKEMLEETEEEANKFTLDQAEKRLCDLIYIHFISKYM